MKTNSVQDGYVARVEVKECLGAKFLFFFLSFLFLSSGVTNVPQLQDCAP